MTLLDGRYHVFTSPDVRGLHISMNTAHREAISVLDEIAREEGSQSPVSAGLMPATWNAFWCD